MSVDRSCNLTLTWEHFGILQQCFGRVRRAKFSIAYTPTQPGANVTASRWCGVGRTRTDNELFDFCVVSIVCLGNISDKSSCWEQPQTSPPSLHSLIYMKLLLMVLDYRVHTAALVWFFFFKKHFQTIPGVKCNSHTERRPHISPVHGHAGTHTSALSLSPSFFLSTPQGASAWVCVCVCSKLRKTLLNRVLRCE